MEIAIGPSRFNFVLQPERQSCRPEDTILRGTRSFAVIASLGALVPGWLLVIPKRPMLNATFLSPFERGELVKLLDELVPTVRKFSDRVFVFEHGSGQSGSLTGCGVEQAHIHIVPLNFDLSSAATRKPEARWTTRACSVFSDLLCSDGEYLAIHEYGAGEGMIGYLPRPESQWIRRVIAEEIGQPSSWNYREHPFKTNVLSTVQSFSGLENSAKLSS